MITFKQKRPLLTCRQLPGMVVTSEIPQGNQFVDNVGAALLALTILFGGVLPSLTRT